MTEMKNEIGTDTHYEWKQLVTVTVPGEMTHEGFHVNALYHSYYTVMIDHCSDNHVVYINNIK